MDLSTYNFPKVTKIDSIFSTFKADEILLSEAKKRNPKKGIEKFKEIFYYGGEVKFKENFYGTWKENAYNYSLVLMKSFDLKHEHKELIVGMIFEEVLELN